MSVTPLELPEKVLIFDVETTGFSPSAQIVQIAIINQDGETLLHTLVKPSIPIPPDASNVHGITDEQVKDAPTFEDIYPQIEALFSGAPLVIAYNIDFDRRILVQECIRTQKLVPTTSYFCAMRAYANKSPHRIWRGKGRGFKWWKLGEACAHWGIEINGAHGALADCQATLALVQLMQRGFENE